MFPLKHFVRKISYSFSRGKMIFANGPAVRAEPIREAQVKILYSVFSLVCAKNYFANSSSGPWFTTAVLILIKFCYESKNVMKTRRAKVT